jgi:shikimate kinase
VEQGETDADTRIFLIGYRGTGKSTVARELAARLGWDWVDADDLIEQRAGKSIAAIFSDDGETAFRDLESDVVNELCGRQRTIVALGGGSRPRSIRCWPELPPTNRLRAGGPA